MAASLWPQRVYQMVQNVARHSLCGSVCVQDEICELFVIHNEVCYLGSSGTFSVISEQSGDASVFLGTSNNKFYLILSNLDLPYCRHFKWRLR